MAHAFVSYVRENQRKVDKMCTDLNLYGVDTWVDRISLKPGERWRTAIRQAIRNGAAFIACFSPQFAAKYRTYMHEELTVAITELRKWSTDYPWFIPVLLAPCSVPDRDIGGGETLRDIQHVELYRNWRNGIRSILETIDRLPGVDLKFDIIERLDALFEALSQLKIASDVLWRRVNQKSISDYTRALGEAMEQLLVAAPAIDRQDRIKLTNLLHSSFDFKAGKVRLLELRKKGRRLSRHNYRYIERQIDHNRDALGKLQATLGDLKKRYQERHIKFGKNENG